MVLQLQAVFALRILIVSAIQNLPLVLVVCARAMLPRFCLLVCVEPQVVVLRKIIFVMGSLICVTLIGMCVWIRLHQPMWTTRVR